MAIWLSKEIDEVEVHVQWHHHETLESAKAEFAMIKKNLLQGGMQFDNTYIYEADAPLYGYEESIDDLGELDGVISDMSKASHDKKSKAKKRDKRKQ